MVGCTHIFFENIEILNIPFERGRNIILAKIVVTPFEP